MMTGSCMTCIFARPVPGGMAPDNLLNCHRLPPSPFPMQEMGLDNKPRLQVLSISPMVQGGHVCGEYDDGSESDDEDFN